MGDLALPLELCEVARGCCVGNAEQLLNAIVGDRPSFPDLGEDFFQLLLFSAVNDLPAFCNKISDEALLVWRRRRRVLGWGSWSNGG